MNSGRRAYRARYVFPVMTPPIVDGVVTIENGLVVEVGRETHGGTANDLGNVAILPGMINAHTHLELSGLVHPVGRPGMAFTDWVRLVVDYRRSSPPYAANLAAGRRECTRTGQVAIGDIATSTWTTDDGPLAATVFHETIGLRRELIDARLAAARAYLDDIAPLPRWRHGLSPHAPYSVHPELFDGLLGLARSAGAPVAFHLAETLEELELLRSGGGPFRQLLIDLGAWDETAIPRGTRPLDYLRRLADSGIHVLVIHGNYLDEQEIDLLAANADRMTVVYCPRTHAFFGHARHPLPRLLASGVNVAIGTDSRASNPDLDVLQELRYVARAFPEIPPSVVLEFATIRAARALEMEDRLGTIEAGKLAALAVVPLANEEATDPHELLFDSDLSATLLVDPILPPS
ncbi:MAG TPA: amidohydrolase family protein [Pirellulales bacterium]|nr:amidohydrolase family protein [Pirellulales bacterium]